MNNDELEVLAEAIKVLVRHDHLQASMALSGAISREITQRSKADGVIPG